MCGSLRFLATRKLLFQSNSAQPIKDGTAAMGKTHLKPLIAVIIQSAKLTESEQKEVIIQSAELTESEQTKVCSEAHDSDPVCFSDRIISSKARFGCEY